MIKWIFFDVGNIIFNDDPAMAYIYESLHKAIIASGKNMSLASLLFEREQLIINNKDGKHHHTLGEKYLGKPYWKQLREDILLNLNNNYLEFNKLIFKIKDEIQILSTKYKLGIAANQVKACRSVLEELGILKYFDIVGISDEMKYQKPDLAFFNEILSKKEIRPQTAIMIGDRIDNDIVPAKAIGMRTIWVNWDIKNKGYVPQTDYQMQYFQSQLRASSQGVRPANESESPDIELTSVENLSEKIFSYNW